MINGEIIRKAILAGMTIDETVRSLVKEFNISLGGNWFTKEKALGEIEFLCRKGVLFLKEGKVYQVNKIKERG